MEVNHSTRQSMVGERLKRMYTSGELEFWHKQYGKYTAKDRDETLKEIKELTGDELFRFIYLKNDEKKETPIWAVDLASAEKKLSYYFDEKDDIKILEIKRR